MTVNSNRNRINIGYVINKLLVGGTENQVVEIINRLDRDKFNPVLFILVRTDNDTKLISEVKCKVVCLNIQGLVNLSIFKKVANFLKLLKENNIHILHCFFPDSSLLGSVIGIIARIPKTIVSRRDLGYWLTATDRYEYKISAKLANKILANSNAVMDSVVKMDGVSLSKINVIHNGIDINDYDAIRINKTYTNNIVEIGIISNFNRKIKRLDVFTKAMIIIANNCQNTRFTIVGNIQWDHWDISIPVDLKDRFIFVGSSNCINDYLKLFDIGINCSDSEGFSNVIMEYMASGVAVVCSHIDGNLELITDGEDGLLFHPGDCDDLASKVLKLINSSELRKIMTDKAHTKIENLCNWNVVIKRYEDYYLNEFPKTC